MVKRQSALGIALQLRSLTEETLRGGDLRLHRERNKALWELADTLGLQSEVSRLIDEWSLREMKESCAALGIEI